MADASGQAEIRGLDIDKVAKGFAEVELKIKRFITMSTTMARDIRWYQKTAGFLDSVDTTGITASQIANTSFRSLPTVVEQSWTRKTSYVRKYFVESPTISSEDIKDSDVDILATNIRDLVRAVANQVETRIYNVVTDNVSGTPFDGSDVPSAAAAGTGWDDATNGDAIGDLLGAKANLMINGYNPEGATLYLHPTDHKLLLSFLISIKGSSIPNFSSERVREGVVMEVLGLNVVVSANATTDYAVVFNREAVMWKAFMPITTAVIDDPGIGKKIRVWEEGEALLINPNAAYGITDTTS